MSEKQRKQLISKGSGSLLVIEQFLNKNEEYLKENETLTDNRRLSNLLDPIPYINSLNKINIKNLCTDCYLSEYNSQKTRQDEIFQRITKYREQLTREKDSLNQVERVKIEKIRESERLRKDSLNAINSSNVANSSPKKNAYDNFIMSMEMVGRNEIGHRYFTVFCDIDLDLASNRLGLYLQDNGLTYDDNGNKTTQNKVTYKFVPKVSTKGEYMSITYTFNENKSLLSYATAVTGSYSPCYPIKSVEIIGTKDIVLSLYLNYWGLKNLKIGGYKGNETSYNEYMGDYIAFTPVSNKIGKINITKRDNIEMNYYKNFKIE